MKSSSQSNHPQPAHLTTINQLAHFVGQYRRTFNKSQRELAADTGLTQAAIAAIEAGQANPTLATIEKLAAGTHAEASLQFRAKR